MVIKHACNIYCIIILKANRSVGKAKNQIVVEQLKIANNYMISITHFGYMSSGFLGLIVSMSLGGLPQRRAETTHIIVIRASAK